MQAHPRPRSRKGSIAQPRRESCAGSIAAGVAARLGDPKDSRRDRSQLVVLSIDQQELIFHTDGAHHASQPARLQCHLEARILESGLRTVIERVRGIVCRLFGYVARQPLSVIDLLGQDEFRAFTALAAVHGDGWGMAWLDAEDQTLRSVTSAASAMRDPTYEQLAGQRLGCAGMVHLRWATPGFQVTSENTHPFVHDGYAFAHNGHIFPVERLEHLLKPAIRAELRAARTASDISVSCSNASPNSVTTSRDGALP